jgi:glyceraldehyde-3-phosphate dehydrogenase (NAD(P))
MELAKHMGKKRADRFEIAVWRDGVHVVDNVLYYYQAIHQESDVVPENVDAIRAMCNLEADNMKSIEKTNLVMGID